MQRSVGPVTPFPMQRPLLQKKAIGGSEDAPNEVVSGMIGLVFVCAIA